LQTKTFLSKINLTCVIFPSATNINTLKGERDPTHIIFHSSPKTDTFPISTLQGKIIIAHVRFPSTAK
jgi:hypothetical protein